MKPGAENPLILAMREKTFYDHPVEAVELIETHISWVFLAGDFAYKVKKPVDFGFLDFSTRAKRKHFCHEELRLNRRFAPQLYLAVKEIGGDPASPSMGGRPVIDYAVQMRRFAQQDQLDRILASGGLQVGQMARFASMIASLHRTASVALSELPFGTPQSVIAPILENFSQICALIPEKERHQLAALEQWSGQAGKDLAGVLQQRKAHGFIRECHGDLHLANMAWFEGEPLLFDCLEFNDNLRWIDVINDIAFLLMDLHDRGQTELAWSFLNHYLQESGDYQGLLLLRFYLVYRAMVRAKVLCLRLAQPGLSTTERRQDNHLYHSYLALAERFTEKAPALLILTHGLSGSGKSTFAREFAACYGAIHLQADRERKRLYGLSAGADSHSPPGGGIYSAGANLATYQKLCSLAEVVLTAGCPVLVDAAFLKKAQRELLVKLASRLGVPLVILDFPLPAAELRRRIEERIAEGLDPSEANIAVLERQLVEQEPFVEGEQRLVVSVTPEMSPALLAERIPCSHARR